jgi:hypothetical protein
MLRIVCVPGLVRLSFASGLAPQATAMFLTRDVRRPASQLTGRGKESGQGSSLVVERGRGLCALA